MRVMPWSDALAAVAAHSPSLFPAPLGVYPADGRPWLITEFPRGVRLDHDRDRARRHPSLALAMWRVAAAGHLAADVDLRDWYTRSGALTLLRLPPAGDEPAAARALVFAASALLNRRTTVSGGGASLLRVAARALGGDTAATLIARHTAHTLPNANAVRGGVAALIDSARSAAITQALAVPDTEQAAAVHWLLLSECAARALHAGSTRAPGGAPVLRVLGPDTAANIARRLEQLSDQPTIALVLAPPRETERELGALAKVHALPVPQPAELLQWLRPLGWPAEAIVGEMAPLFAKPPEHARRLLLALLERAGAQLTDQGLSPGDQWAESLHELSRPRAGPAVAHPAAARLAVLLSLSTAGVAASEVDASKELSAGMQVLSGLGMALRDGSVVRAAAGATLQDIPASQRRAGLLWLAERPHFCPVSDTLSARAWSLALRLRAGDLPAWASEGEQLCRDLLNARKLHELLDLHEAHAVAGSRRGVGPPSLDALLDAAELGIALWPARRRRRLLRMWLRGYHGELRALALALLARAERTIGAPTDYRATLNAALALNSDANRLLRELTILECAACLHQDDSELGDRLLQQLPARLARDATYLSSARLLYLRAHSLFVQLRPGEAMARLQEARALVSPRAPWLRRMRMLGQIESLNANAWAQATLFKHPTAPVIDTLRKLEADCGCVGDQLCSAVVNDFLFRARMREPGTISPDDLGVVLAHAPPHNRRGYAVVLHALSDNAVYAGDIAQGRQITARMKAMGADKLSGTVAASVARHTAILHCLQGDFTTARNAWRGAGLRALTEPWRTRTRAMKHGEWGVVLALAGRFERASHFLRKAVHELVAFQASTRASAFLALDVLCCMLRGTPYDPQFIEGLDNLARRKHILPAAVLALHEAFQPGGNPARLPETLDSLPAPPLWVGGVLAVAAVLARKRGMRESALLAQAARASLPQPVRVLHDWLDLELPRPAAPSAPRNPRVLEALATVAPAADTLQTLQAVVSAARAALGAACVVARAGAVTAASGETDAELHDALEQAAIGAEVNERGLLAVPLQAAVGAIAAHGADMDSLRAFARRLDELIALLDARHEREHASRHKAIMARAAWALADPAAPPPERLAAMAQLAAAGAGSRACEVALMRGAQVVLATHPASDWDVELSARVDHTLTLRLRARGGLRDALEQAAANAALAVSSMLAEHGGRLRSELGRPEGGETLVAASEPLGDSPAARRLHDELRRYADIDLPVTITGEPGTGKDLAAKALHAMSQRASAPHIVLDCATLRIETAASELFGHVTGAFTGANVDHTGLLETAGEGNLQIDGIAELAPQIQSMLLRVLQVRRFLPVGATAEREFKARVIVTSTQPLEALVQQGRLREDLAARLAGLTLAVPPLRERGNDAITIARHVLKQQSAHLGKPLRLSSRAEQHIASQAWPGNVRELKAAVTRAAVLGNGEVIEPADMQQQSETHDSIAMAGDSDMTLTQKLALGLLRKQGELTPRALMNRLGISRTTASQTLSQLAAQGQAQRKGQGRASRYVAIE
ncbi:MAG: sigma-54-dependent Fis family transcriptional regulator [Planctomycetota bacterium]|nr:sigma-54-dependent Fis family transcriptional regulator [Planctomycetota bacterium]